MTGLKGRTALFLIVASFFAFLSSCVVINIPTTAPLVEKVIGGEGRDKVLVIDISGVIRDEERGSPLSFSEEPGLTARIREELDKAAGDGLVRGVILKINSPGGEVTTTDVIHHEIKRFREKTGVYVMAQMMDTAASGGYYIATAADSIAAHPTTVTGSIGVVAYRISAAGLIEKIGITDETVKSGDKKDMGSPLRGMTGEERRVMQGVVDELFENFLDVVRASRGFDDASFEAVKDGRIYTAGEALRLGLIDSIGYMEDAVEAVKQRAGVKEARIVTYARPGAYRSNIYSAAALSGLGASTQINLVNIDAAGLASRLGFSFMYLWMP